MSIIDQIREGDLVEAAKGETIIRGRVNRDGVVGDSMRRTHGLERNGYTLTVVEKATPPPPTEPAVPTEPGHYLSAAGFHWEIGHGSYTLNPLWAPYTRLEPVPDTVKRVADYLRGYGRRLAADDVEEHFGVTS